MSSKRSGGTIKCRIPFLVQIEQLQSTTDARSAVTRKRTRPQWQPPSMIVNIAQSPFASPPWRPIAALVFPSLAAQPPLCRIARGLGEAEMAEGMRRQQPPARRALDEAFLDQERLDDVLDGVARLGQRRRDGIDPDRPAAVVLRDCGEIAPVHGIEPGGV